MKEYYLAYGSNLNLEEMKYRCRSAKPIGKLILNGYRLVYKGDSDNYAYLTLEKDLNSFVPLGLYELSIFDIKSLDLYEGYPELYSKIYLPININNKKQKALIYIMNDEFDYHLPSIEYINTCIKGYHDFGFDINILKKAYIDTYKNLNKNKKIGI